MLVVLTKGCFSLSPPPPLPSPSLSLSLSRHHAYNRHNGRGGRVGRLRELSKKHRELNPRTLDQGNAGA